MFYTSSVIVCNSVIVCTFIFFHTNFMLLKIITCSKKVNFYNTLERSDSFFYYEQKKKL